MKRRWSGSVLAWITRVLSIAFVALQAFAWWDESRARQDLTLSGDVSGDWFWQWAILTHLLPLALIAAATVVGWRWPSFGLVGFGVFAILQGISVGTEWVYLPLVAGPPLVIAVLYLVGVIRGQSAR